MKVKNFLIGVAIAFIYTFVIGYGINTFHSPPDYGDFCSKGFERPLPYPIRAEMCPYNPQIEQNPEAQQCITDGGYLEYNYNESGCIESYKSCNFCQRDYDAARNEYSLSVFIIAGIAGLTAIVIGGVLFSVEAVGAGLMGGGILSLFYANIMHWRNMDNLLKFVILLIALVVVIGVGLWINRKRKDPQTVKKDI